MNHYIALFAFIMLLLSWSCNPEPKPIEFGQEACHYCKMTIVDKAHAAEVVTNKGKAFAFDAIECMLQYLNEGKYANELALHLTCTMDNPGRLSTAEECTYLISEAIPSPMGAYLSAYSRQTLAKTAKVDFGGNIYNWNELRERFAAGAISFSGK